MSFYIDPAAVLAAHDKMVEASRERASRLKGGDLQVRAAEMIGRAAMELLTEFLNKEVDEATIARVFGGAAGNLLKVVRINFGDQHIPAFFASLERIGDGDVSLCAMTRVDGVEGGTA